jgi:hypothetical protein
MAAPSFRIIDLIALQVFEVDLYFEIALTLLDDSTMASATIIVI